MDKIVFKEKNIAYSKSGEGKLPLVLLHGFCEDSRLWDDWLELFHYQPIIKIDLPGFGESELLGDPSIELMAEAVKAVLDHLEVEKCVLFGHSMGGYVSLAFAEKHGEMLAGLCLFHSQPYADTEEKKAGRLKSIEFIQTNGTIPFVKQMIPGLFAADFSAGYTMEVNKLIHYAASYSPEAIIAALHAMRNRPDRSEVLRNIACPVLFFVGKLDAAISHENSLAQTHLPDQADIHIYPTVGHMGMFEAARETAKAAKEFLKRLTI